VHAQQFELCIPAKFNFYIRTVDPDLTRPFATHLHTYMKKAYIKIATGIDLDSIPQNMQPPEK
jgi:hypothetical protein